MDLSIPYLSIHLGTSAVNCGAWDVSSNSNYELDVGNRPVPARLYRYERWVQRSELLLVRGVELP
jgi:hypothetical protein